LLIVDRSLPEIEMHGWNESVSFYKTFASASLKISMKSPEMYQRRLFLFITTKIQGRNETTKEISSNSLFLRYDCNPPLRVPSALCPRHAEEHTSVMSSCQSPDCQFSTHFLSIYSSILSGFKSLDVRTAREYCSHIHYYGI
jgi:hypothetical protein